MLGIAEAGAIMALDTGTTAWMLVATALVILMTPGVGLFYGGMVRKKNFISMFALSFVALAFVSLQWVLFGYSLVFGTDIGGVIGDLSHAGLAGVGLDPGCLLYTSPSPRDGLLS